MITAASKEDEEDGDDDMDGFKTEDDEDDGSDGEMGDDAEDGDVADSLRLQKLVSQVCEALQKNVNPVKNSFLYLEICYNFPFDVADLRTIILFSLLKMEVSLHVET